MDRPALANRFKENSTKFIEFIKEVVIATNQNYPDLRLNLRIYQYLDIAVKVSDPAEMIRNFIHASTMPSASQLQLTRDQLPIIEGSSRFPYWENVRLKNVQFFSENVSMLIPKIDLSKLDKWKPIFPDLNTFTKEFIESEIKKILLLFGTNKLSEDDVNELWAFLRAYIKDAIRYTSQEQPEDRKFYPAIDVKREARLFMNSDDLKKFKLYL